MGRGDGAKGWAQGPGILIVILENDTPHYLYCTQHTHLATRPQIRHHVVHVHELVSLLIQIIVTNKDKI